MCTCMYNEYGEFSTHHDSLDRNKKYARTTNNRVTKMIRFISPPDSISTLPLRSI